MAAKALSAFSYFPAFPSLNFQRRQAPKLCMLKRPFGSIKYNLQHLTTSEAHPCMWKNEMLGLVVKFPRRQHILIANCGDEVMETDFFEPEVNPSDTQGISPATASDIHYGENVGKSGFVSFHATPPERTDVSSSMGVQRKRNSLLWFVGPTVLVASFIFPSLYLRKIISSIFEDSLLTDFLILFFAEALFYSGVAIFLILMDCLWRSSKRNSTASDNKELTSQLSYRISSVAILVLSLIIPLVTMGFVWPWTGPAASATLAPYLVGIVVQFAFEQYVKYVKSPCWPAIPIIFQVYRLHQLNRAAQLVTALSFTVRGVEMTSHNVAINNSLGTLLNVLQLLGILCIWSLASFLVRFFPSSIAQQ